MDHLIKLFVFNRNEFEFQLHLLKTKPYSLRLIAYLDGQDICCTRICSTWSDMILFAITGKPTAELREMIDQGEY